MSKLPHFYYKLIACFIISYFGTRLFMLCLPGAVLSLEFIGSIIYMYMLYLTGMCIFTNQTTTAEYLVIIYCLTHLAIATVLHYFSMEHWQNLVTDFAIHLISLSIISRHSLHNLFTFHCIHTASTQEDYNGVVKIA